ncbi:hypothetical protein MMC22_010659 [Lobaria immixta]|nr:hypothetical protein [Lobaria immixta]
MSSQSHKLDGYGLERTHLSSARLDLQHYLVKDILRYNIHPDIPVRDEKDFKIADVGTGTGIWVIDVNRQLSTASIDGFDISADQFPPKEWLPSNVSLGTFDALLPIPDELIEKYDIIHVRIFVAVVKNEDPTPILKNLISMLKPGGYVQWTEFNPHSERVTSARPELKKTALEQVQGIINPHMHCNWVARLSQLFTQQGLTDVHTFYHPVSPEMQVAATRVIFMARHEINLKAQADPKSPLGGAEFSKLNAEAFEELNQGVALVITPEVTVGRKRV